VVASRKVESTWESMPFKTDFNHWWMIVRSNSSALLPVEMLRHVSHCFLKLTGHGGVKEGEVELLVLTVVSLLLHRSRIDRLYLPWRSCQKSLFK
jgi:hypothetical protein